MKQRRARHQAKLDKFKAIENVIKYVAANYDPEANPWSFERNVAIYLDRIFTMTWKHNEYSQMAQDELRK